jgi:fructokinase
LNTPQIICMGEALIDLLPTKPGQSLLEARTLRRLPGGAPANLAVGLARLGVRVAFLSKLGNDPLGWFLRDVMLKNKVLVEGLTFSDSVPTGISFAWVNKTTGEPQYFFYDTPRADYFLESEEINWQWFKSAQIFQFSSTTLARSPVRETNLAALQTAFEAGQLVSYDVNIRMPAWTDRQTAREKMLEVLPKCHIVKLNQPELAFLTGETDVETGIKKLWQNHLYALLVTVGEKGCFYRIPSGTGVAFPFKVKVADTIGAGDGWMAGFLSQILENGAQKFDFADAVAVAQACRYANAVGALTSTKAGAMTALPSRRKVNLFLKNVNLPD